MQATVQAQAGGGGNPGATGGAVSQGSSGAGAAATTVVPPTVEFQGHLLEPGQTVHFINPCANMDPKVFGTPEPEQFDLRRLFRRRHLAFGYGDHLCPGMLLGKLQVSIFHACVVA